MRLRTTGKLYCWGINTAGQLGDGTETPRTSPKQIGTATDWKLVAASRYQHTCGIRGSGNLYCWGHNHFGQLGDGSTSKHTSPTRIGTFADWGAALPRQFPHTCGVRTNGKLYCWGSTDYGKLGITYSADKETSPKRVGSFQDWVSVGAGHSDSCALRANGKLYCWGKYLEGASGQRLVCQPRAHSHTCRAPSSGSRLTSGDNHNCAIRVGELYCWGRNNEGQVGSHTNITPFRSPQRV